MDEIMLIVGTRPEIIKMAPVIRALQVKSFPFVFVHCGQHYDYNMSQQFIEELELPKPDYGFIVKVSSSILQTSRIIAVTGKKVIIAGVYNRIEIWDEKKWKGYKQKTEKEVGDIAERLKELGV